MIAECRLNDVRLKETRQIPYMLRQLSRRQYSTVTVSMLFATDERPSFSTLTAFASGGLQKQIQRRKLGIDRRAILKNEKRAGVPQTVLVTVASKSNFVLERCRQGLVGLDWIEQAICDFLGLVSHQVEP